SLGQNFLIDRNILNKILDGANINKDDYVLEVGPGIGTLTVELAKKADRVVAIEVDDKLIPILNDTLRDYDNVHVVNDDILDIDLYKLITNYFGGNLFKIVANLPYYITTPIIMKFLESNFPYTDIVVMVQREVAERMVAHPGTKDYGALTVAVRYYTEPSIIVNVPASVFMPPPKVDSAVVKLTRREDTLLADQEAKLFFQIVKGAFSKRRKTLLNALSSYPFEENIGSKAEIREMLKESGIEPDRRGETLSVDEFAHLTSVIYEHKILTM
ncbi:MAG TPA: 16S rRNA (adenine(1518)-N(6)/adenine(1519)-N(6))-dimethyltransferase RsmA, partial [Clostridiales bacterium]|nr:16S rRNA (adenine(1518)-N(6)/adenine(1519)-N(6))-dimethyltransferase RsmA [Clostridiales bacterium]